jgi:azurin
MKSSAAAALCLLSSAVCLLGADEMLVTIRTLASQMKYDTPEFIVTPGAKVRLTLVNDDEMPHNLVVTKPSDDKGLALAQTAWALGDQGLAKHWIPSDPRVIAATKMVAPHAKEELVFEAPQQLGAHPYVCTFPGHAMVMNGVMRVVRHGSKLTDGRFQLYLGKWDKLPDFGSLKPLREGALEDNLIQWKFDDYKNEFGIRFTGKLDVKTEGEYTFRISSDDGSRLSVDGKVVVDNDGCHPADDGKLGKTVLKPGVHDLQLDYFQGNAGADLYASWQGPGFSETWLSKRELGVAPARTGGDAHSGMPLIVKDEAIIYRNFIAGAGTRAIGVGYPGGVNAVFDADLCNVTLVWRGGFIDAKRHWTDRGEGFQPPLGYGVVALDRNVPLAVLSASDSLWPAQPADVPNGDWPEGYRFRGYQLDKKGIPTFRYTWHGLIVEDRMEAAPSTGGPGGALHRIVTLTGKTEDGTHFRVVTGKRIAAGKDGVFPLDEGITLKVPDAVIRQSGGAPELLVPVKFANGQARIVMTYTWNH